MAERPKSLTRTRTLTAEDIGLAAPAVPLGGPRLVRMCQARADAIRAVGADLLADETVATHAGQWEALAAALPGLLADAALLDREGVRAIAAERKRQTEREGWTDAHDDTHTRGEMAISAACYAANGTDAEVTVSGEDAFPWGSCHDKRAKHPRLRQLAIAGALVAAEIDRLSRVPVEGGE